MIVVSLLLLAIFVYTTVRVSQKVWPNEKAVPLMLIALCITLLTMMGYYTFLIVDMRHPGWFCSEDRSYFCAQSFFAQLPALCLANAIILNLNKWVYFYLRISAFI